MAEGERRGHTIAIYGEEFKPNSCYPGSVRMKNIHLKGGPGGGMGGVVCGRGELFRHAQMEHAL